MIFLSCYKIVAWLQILKWGLVFLEGSLKGIVFSFSCLSKWYSTYSTHCIGFLKLDHFSFFFFSLIYSLVTKKLLLKYHHFPNCQGGWLEFPRPWRRYKHAVSRRVDSLILIHQQTASLFWDGVKKSKKEMDEKTFQGFIIFSWSANKCIFHRAFQLFCFPLIYCSLGGQFPATDTIL